MVGKREIKANYFVIATHVPLMGNTGLVSTALFQSKLFLYSSYVIGATIPRGLISEASFWDTAEPYHYLRVEAGQARDYVIFGGEDHKTGQDDDPETRYARLEETLRQLIPEAKVDHRWSGQVVETNDGLPYIGETAEHQFAATGFAGNGMTFGTLSALMARDAVLGRDNPWNSLFSMDRKKIRRSAWRYLTENFDYPFFYVKDRLTRVEGDSTREVKRGEGKIIGARWRTGGLLARRDGEALDRVTLLHAHGLPGPLEWRGENLGLSLPWLPLSSEWRSFGGTGRVSARPAAETSRGKTGDES